MKKKALPFVFSLLMLMSFTVGSFGQNRDFKSSSGVRDLGTSEVTTTTEFYTAGTTMNVSFAVVYDGDFAEFIDQVDFDFPATITVNPGSSSEKIDCPDFGTYLNITNPSPETWVAQYNNSSFTGPIGSSSSFNVNITIPGGFSGNLSIGWTITGTDGKSTTNGTLILTEASSVDDPTSVAASAASTSSIGLSWVKNGSGDDVMVAYNTMNTFGVPSGNYSVNDPIIGGGTVIYNGSGTSTTHTTLTSGTKYFYKVFSVSTSKATSYSNGVEVSAMPAVELPLSEGFENGGAMPLGWTLETAATANAWVVSTNAKRSGTYGIGVTQTDGNPKDAWFFSQPISLDAGTYILDFYYRADGANTEILDVSVGEEANATAMTNTFIDDLTFSSGSFTQEHSSLTVASAGVYYIGFHAVSTANQNYIHIDDIEITEGTAGLWTGNTNTDWATASNWDNLAVPGASDDVSIPDVSTGGLSGNLPIITNAKIAASCNNLTIAANAVLTIQSGGTLAIGGDLLLESEHSFGTTKGGSLVDQTDGGVTITGTSTVKLEMLGAEVPDNDQWHLISSPVGSFNSSDVFWNCFLRTFDESTGAYVNVGEGSTESTAMLGYATMYYYGGGASNTKELNFSGTLNTGTKNILCSKTLGQDGWNLVGNPYPSAIDWDLVDNGSFPANLNKTFYVLDGTTQTFKYYLKGGSGNTATQYLPAMQGFFVECNNSAGATLQFGNGYRCSEQESFLKSENANQNVITLKVRGNEIDDQTTIYFREQATAGFDRDFDVHKMFTAAVKPPQIYSTQPNEFFAVNAYDESNRPDEVNIGFLSGLSGSYTLAIPDANLIDSDISLLLYDTKLDVHIDLRQMENYSFSYDVNDDPNRFKLQLSTTSVDEQNLFPFNIWVSGSQLTINPNNQDIQSIKVFDLTGRLIINQEYLTGEGQYQMQLPEVSSVYIVEIQTVEGVYSRKIVQ